TAFVSPNLCPCDEKSLDKLNIPINDIQITCELGQSSLSRQRQKAFCPGVDVFCVHFYGDD
ncbi:MAG: hypothetical protein AAF892_09190, partial [Cyanobacteria bacterium P01_D01_bin.71]